MFEGVIPLEKDAAEDLEEETANYDEGEKDCWTETIISIGALGERKELTLKLVFSYTAKWEK
jgi:hypothetical protein